MPTACPLFVDKLAVTLALRDPDAHAAVLGWFSETTDRRDGYAVRSTRGGRFYSQSKEIVFDENCKVLAEFNSCWGEDDDIPEYRDAESEPDLDVCAIRDTRRPLRLEWNPARMVEAPEYRAAFMRLLRDWLGDSFSAEMQDANITRIDLAVDVESLDINNIGVSRADTTVISTNYGRDGLMQSLYLGAKNTDLRFVIYDKRAERGGLIVPRQVALTRFEARIKHRMKVSELFDFPNPFARLTVREFLSMEVNVARNSQHVWRWFVDTCKWRGAEAAIDLIRNSRTRAAWHRKFVERDRPRWWSPNEIWSGLRSAIDDVGVFRVERHIRRSRG